MVKFIVPHGRRHHLHAADTTRQQPLVPLRYGRMLQSPFTFYRRSVGAVNSR
jgi:hypothetical protein